MQDARIWTAQEKLGLYIQHFPSGLWGFVGKVPEVLCHQSKGLFPQLVSNLYDTKQAAYLAAKQAGYPVRKEASGNLGHKIPGNPGKQDPFASLFEEAKKYKTAEEFYLKTGGGKYNLDFIEKMKGMQTGELAGKLGDFIIGEKTRAVLGEDVLNTKVIIQKNISRDVPILGASGQLKTTTAIGKKGERVILIDNKSSHLASSIIGTFLEEAAHTKRALQGREMRKIDLKKFNFPDYEKLPQEISGKRFAKYLHNIEEDQSQLINIWKQAKGNPGGHRIPPTVYKLRELTIDNIRNYFNRKGLLPKVDDIIMKGDKRLYITKVQQSKVWDDEANQFVPIPHEYEIHLETTRRTPSGREKRDYYTVYGVKPRLGGHKIPGNPPQEPWQMTRKELLKEPDIEFRTLGGLIKSGTISNIYGEKVYVIPDGAKTSIPIDKTQIIRQISTRRVGRKPIVAKKEIWQKSYSESTTDS